ncbi:MAG: preprotein translocase subunit YajC [Alphaproteobacteria bacterium]|nr:preprotein translocase subunit YajC [Alphaproteobacteria bacterium]
MFISQAFAQSGVPTTAGSSLMANVLQILLIFLVFYLLLIRPQQKKFKQHEAELLALQKGDQVITAGGIYATVTQIDGNDLTLEIAKGVEVKAHRFTLREVIKPQSINQKSQSKGKKHV